VAYVLMFRVIRGAGATTASTVTYVIPLFATLIGVLVLDEHLTWYEPVGGLVVLAGVAISQGAFRLPKWLRAVGPRQERIGPGRWKADEVSVTEPS